MKKTDIIVDNHLDYSVTHMRWLKWCWPSAMPAVTARLDGVLRHHMRMPNGTLRDTSLSISGFRA